MSSSELRLWCQLSWADLAYRSGEASSSLNLNLSFLEMRHFLSHFLAVNSFYYFHLKMCLSVDKRFGVFLVTLKACSFMTKKASPCVVDDHKLSGPLVFLSVIYKNLQRRRTVFQKAVDDDSVPALTVQVFVSDCFGQPFDLFLFWFSLCKMWVIVIPFQHPSVCM